MPRHTGYLDLTLLAMASTIQADKLQAVCLLGVHNAAIHCTMLLKLADMTHTAWHVSDTTAVTWRVVETLASHVSPLAPDQVPSRDKHTLPQLYRFGLNRTAPPPVSKYDFSANERLDALKPKLGNWLLPVAVHTYRCLHLYMLSAATHC